MSQKIRNRSACGGINRASHTNVSFWRIPDPLKIAFAARCGVADPAPRRTGRPVMCHTPPRRAALGTEGVMRHTPRRIGRKSTVLVHRKRGNLRGGDGSPERAGSAFRRSAPPFGQYRRLPLRQEPGGDGLSNRRSTLHEETVGDDRSEGMLERDERSKIRMI